MSNALHVVLKEPDDEGQALLEALSGKALARHIERVDIVADRLGMPPLMSFFSVPPDEMEAMLDVDDFRHGDEDEDEEDAADAPPAHAAGDEEQDEEEDDESDADPDDPVFVEQWFAPAEGLETVRALIDHLELEPGALPDGDEVLADLRHVERILAHAEARKTEFHVALDF